MVEDLPAWNPAMRSKTAIRTSPKRHFIDPSIATAVLRATPDSLLTDFNTFGLLFESMCIRDLRVYAEALDGEVFHYRDKSGLEADAIIHLKDGRWGAVEVKLGAKEIEMATENLKILKNKVNTDKMKEPSFLMVLTGTELAYRRYGLCSNSLPAAPMERNTRYYIATIIYLLVHLIEVMAEYKIIITSLTFLIYSRFFNTSAGSILLILRTNSLLIRK